MEVVLLGTGAAAGWPNPFCPCASCEWMRANGDVRGQTAALVDNVMLLDCGPEAPRAAERLGRPLTGIRHMLFTHAHPDHVGPAALMWREWADRAEPIDVAGPPAVIAACREWVSPNAAVHWHELSAGDVMAIGDYTVHALAAAHGDDGSGPGLLYDVTAADGSRLLWATDTAAMPSGTVGALSGAGFDAVFLEETNGDQLDGPAGHLDLVSWPAQVAELRRTGAVREDTVLVPIHLGHRNPSPPRLVERMTSWGATTPRDGDVFDVGVGVGAGKGLTAQRRPRRVLVLGGARSGKSVWAETILAAEPAVTYVATALPRPADAEWQARVDEHRKRRPAQWRTRETLDLVATLQDGTPVLVDCLTLWVGARMDDDDFDSNCDALVAAVRDATTPVVVVTNEVGSGVVPATSEGRRFRDELGRLNARVAQVCDEVWLVTAGLPRRLA